MTAPSQRTRVKRLHEYGRYDRQTIHAILDATPLAHVSYVLNDAPVVTPTLQWREGDRIYWHGSSASRMLETSTGADVCIAVTLMDAMVLARSGFNHSVNYRSAMIFGTAEKIKDVKAKEAHLRTFMEMSFPGRWDTLRPMSQKELKATTILSLPLDEASAKVTSGMPKDDDEDYAFRVWAGIIPLTTVCGPPQSDPRNLPGLAIPEHAQAYRTGTAP